MTFQPGLPFLERFIAVADHRPQGAAACAAMYGCSMAGSTYAPLDVAAPFDCLACVCAKHEPQSVLTSRAATMKRLLPLHLVPPRVHALAPLPRNANDKIDRLARELACIVAPHRLDPLSPP